MASAPQAQLPLFYKDLMPLNSRDHGKWKMRGIDRAMWVVGEHAIPITAEEFIPAHVYFPIVFSAGDDPVPLALMGLNEGVNVYFNDEGQTHDDTFEVPHRARPRSRRPAPSSVPACRNSGPAVPTG